MDGLIGEGGGGRVYAARHAQLGVRVAIKVLRPEMVPLQHLVTRFNREVEAIPLQTDEDVEVDSD